MKMMNSKNKRNTGVLIFAALISAGMLTGCGNGISNFQKNVENGNYTGAAEEFAKRQDKSDFVAEASAYLLSYVENIDSDFGAGKITEEKAYLELECGNYLANNCNLQLADRIWSALDECSMSLEMITWSKEAFESGEKALEKEDYFNAIQYFSYVDVNDTENYEKAMSDKQQAETKFAESVYQKLEQYISAGESVQAFEYLCELGMKKEAKPEAASDNGGVSIVINTENDIEVDAPSVLDYLDQSKLNSYQDQVVALMIQDVTQAYKDKNASGTDPLEGIKLLDEFYSSYKWAVDDDLFVTTANESLEIYVEQLIAEADAIILTGDYQQAILKASEGLAAFSQMEMMKNHFGSVQESLTEKVEYYKSYIPVLLTDLDATSKSEININYVGGWTLGVDIDTYNQDTNGVIYDSTIMNDNLEGSVTYYLNYQYSKLEGTVYRPYYSLGGKGKSSDWYKDGWVKIYGDDVLLYESPKITQKTYDSYDFNVDVSKVRELTIEMGGVWYPGSGHIPTVGVGNAVISK